jgi:excisionase family DNA binding protein
MSKSKVPDLSPSGLRHADRHLRHPRGGPRPLGLSHLTLDVTRYSGARSRLLPGGNALDGDEERLLTPAQVAALFRVDPKTVTRWAAGGQIKSIRTVGGHRRFRESEVLALLRKKSKEEYALSGSSAVTAENAQSDSETHLRYATEINSLNGTSSAAAISASTINSGASRPDEGSGLTLPSDGERARTAASQYEVVNYSRFGDALLVVLDGSPIMSGKDLPPPVEASIEVNAYLSTEDQVLADSVFNALDALADLLGYEGPYDEFMESGSIFRSAKANLRRGIDSEEALRYRAKLNQAIDLIAIGERQAKVDAAEADAFAKAMAGLGDVTSACVRVGSMLIVKYPDSQGNIVLVRQLSALELRTLERFPGIQRDPRTTIETLAVAVIDAKTVEDSSA